jgi:UDP-4-amino-4,6-dideoxy-N-acetyl-beta-L-altrosamine transaminase
MISYGKQSIDQSDIDTVIDILRGDWLTQGPSVEIFENDLKAYFGADYSCVVSSGTSALHLSGLALDWNPGDVIITSPITFLASVNCIVYAGATPDFVDIDPTYYTIDPNRLEDKIKSYSSKGKKVKAVIGVDYAGHPCDWKALRSIADKYELQLINDNCHAMGASFLSDIQYAVKYADVVIQSYHPVKHITTGEGGAVLTNISEIDSKVRTLRSHGITKDMSILEKTDGPWYYEMHELGYNYRITDFQCALGSNQLKKLDKFVAKRRQIADQYDALFKNNKLLTIPKAQINANHSYHLYPLIIDFEKAQLNKNYFFEKLTSHGINLQVHYIPVHLQPYYRKKYSFKIGDFPNAEKFYEQEISLPVYPSLSKEDQKEVIYTINNIVGEDG